MRDASRHISIVEQGLTIDGTVTCGGQLIVKGVVKGRLEADTVVIAEEGLVQARTEVKAITIGGTFEGDLRVSGSAVILATGCFSGKVTYADMVIEAGGRLSGEVVCTRQADADGGGKKKANPRIQIPNSK